MAKADNPVWTGCEKTRQVRSTFLVEQMTAPNNNQILGKKHKKNSKQLNRFNQDRRCRHRN